MNSLIKTALVLWLGCVSVVFAQPPSPAVKPGQYFVYFGTYTGAKSKGIYVSRFDAGAGKLSPREVAAEIASTSFVAIHPNRRYLYAVN